MYKQSVDIAEESIQLTWDGNKAYQNFTIHQNGAVVTTISDVAHLKAGQRVLLPSKKDIMVILSDAHGLEVWYNGKECISDYASGEVDYFKQAGNGLIAVGVLLVIYTIIMAIATGLDKIGLLMTGVFALFALAFIGAGIWGMKTYDKKAYWLGMILCVFTLLPVLSIFSVIILGFLMYYCYKATQSKPPKHMVVKPDTDLPFDQT